MDATTFTRKSQKDGWSTWRDFDIRHLIIGGAALGDSLVVTGQSPAAAPSQRIASEGTMRECDLASWVSEMKMEAEHATTCEDLGTTDGTVPSQSLELVCLVVRGDPVGAFMAAQLRQVQKELQVKVTVVEEDRFPIAAAELYTAHAFPAVVLLHDRQPVKVLRAGYRESSAIIGPVSTEDLVDFVRHAKDKLLDTDEVVGLKPIPLSF